MDAPQHGIKPFIVYIMMTERGIYAISGINDENPHVAEETVDRVYESFVILK